MKAAGGHNSNPFPGLRPFRPDEQHLFFGRESQIDAMVDTLAHKRFLAVVGISGSGKSSLINCGLRPALHAGLMASAGSAWRMAQFRPGSDPVKSLTRALSEPGVVFAQQRPGGMSLEDIVDTTLRMSKLGLVDIVDQARLPAGVNLLLVVDQFEELFRYRHLGDKKPARGVFGEQATVFVNLLLAAIAQSTLPIYVVLTMRSDFLGECAHFPGLAEAINSGQYLVPRMNREQRRSAIAGPVGVGGAEISPLLLTRLVNDVGDNPDQLSILQHALNRTWARWENDRLGSGMLDLDCYEAVGSMDRALDQHAEKAYEELGSDERKIICERLFKALTDKVHDPRGVRRPTRLKTLCALCQAAADDVIAVIDLFRKPSRSFLMPPADVDIYPESVVDISHESLMRVWRRLDRWATDESEAARMYLRLSETSELYRESNSVLRDPDLRVALQWRKKNKPNEAWASRYNSSYTRTMSFLASSEKSDKNRKRAIWAAALLLLGSPVLFAGYSLQKKALEARKAISELQVTVEEQNSALVQAEESAVQEIIHNATLDLDSRDKEKLHAYVAQQLELRREAMQALADQTETRDMLLSDTLDVDKKRALLHEMTAPPPAEPAAVGARLATKSIAAADSVVPAWQSVDSANDALLEIGHILSALDVQSRQVVVKQLESLERDRINARESMIEMSAEISQLELTLNSPAEAPAEQTHDKTEPDVALAKAPVSQSATHLAAVADGIAVCENVIKLEPQNCRFDGEPFAPGRVYLFARVITPNENETLTLRWQRGDDSLGEKQMTVKPNPKGYRIYSWRTFDAGDYRACLYDQVLLEIGCIDFTVQGSATVTPIESTLAQVQQGNQLQGGDISGLVSPVQARAPAVTVQSLTETAAVALSHESADGFAACASLQDDKPGGCASVLPAGKVYILARIFDQSGAQRLTAHWHRNGSPLHREELTLRTRVADSSGDASAGWSKRLLTSRELDPAAYEVCLSDADSNEIGCLSFRVE